ncbi:FAD-dependent monooxygenase [Actinocorallia sp. A-T 12471]|uniref:FAD-dependent monooxygenase n=1 Tax=Actinocorallia sp. A-T 12471 TaxID=3089813 RepID=UPI0029CDD75D|nr:FAD-dependent monooxygenase [Actinocorallia sp. A-T 12471]MDX6739558.1 FAD-dependent monooxygenase [Actinocorallia sp. A-T 12471]
MGSSIAISGAGIGGLAAAIALRSLGHEVVVYEQAPKFARVGADINLTPNAVRALDGLGVGDALRETAARPTHRISRTYDTGEETSRLPMGDTAELQYGAPQLTMHRADLMSALEAAVPASAIRLGTKVAGLTQDDEGVTLEFADGTSARHAAVIGADGIHSVVRTALFGKESPVFTGVVAYRAVVPISTLSDVTNLDAFTKWWGPNKDTQIVTFPLNRGEDLFIFATIPQEGWHAESWTQPGDVAELTDLYRDFHPEARRLLAACDEVLKSALYVRDPLPTWTAGRATLLGDACHPMMPFMAQGAGQAVEDAVVLARAIDAAPTFEAAFAAYETARLPRTSRIQISSRDNAWLKESGTGDWVYAYNPWTTPLT